MAEHTPSLALKERVERIHRKARAAGRIRPPDPKPRPQLPLALDEPSEAHAA